MGRKSNIMFLVLAALVGAFFLCLWGGLLFDEVLLEPAFIIFLGIVSLLWWPPRPPAILLLILAAGRF